MLNASLSAGPTVNAPGAWHRRLFTHAIAYRYTIRRFTMEPIADLSTTAARPMVDVHKHASTMDLVYLTAFASRVILYHLVDNALLSTTVRPTTTAAPTIACTMLLDPRIAHVILAIH